MKPVSRQQRARPGVPRLRPWLIVSFICVLAGLLRLIYFFQIKDLFFIDSLGIDARHYDELARAIAAGNVLGGEVYFYGPLYSYFLAFIYAVWGESYAVVRLCQFAIGAAACALVFLLGRRHFCARVGYLAAAMAAIHGPLIMFQGTLLYDQLGFVLVPLILLAFGRALRRPQKRWSLLAGWLLGLAALGRGNILLFLPAVLVAYLLAIAPGGPFDRRKAWLAWSAAALGCALAVLPITVRNFVVAGDLVPITANVGLNFYIGNGPEATGGYMNPAGFDITDDHRGQRPAELARGRSLRPSEVSRFWLERTWAHIRAHPGRFLQLLGKKLWLFWLGTEVPQIEHFGFMRQFVGILRIPYFAPLLLAPLALLGMVVGWRQDRQRGLLPLFVAAYVLSIVLFFVVGRYWLPLLPVLMVFASAAIFWFWERIRARSYRSLAAGIATCAVLAIGLHLAPAHQDRARKLAEMHYRVAGVAEAQGRMQTAVQYYRQALAIDPCHGKSLVNMGVLLSRQGDHLGAERSFLAAIRCEAAYAKPYFNLAIAYFGQGRLADAADYLRQAVGLSPDYVEAWQALGMVEAAAGHIEAARAAFARVLTILAGQHPDQDAQDLRAEAERWLAQLAGAREGEAQPRTRGESP